MEEPKIDTAKKEVSPLNLWQRLLKVRETVDYLQKDTASFNYKYHTESAVISALRPALDKYGLFLQISMEKPIQTTCINQTTLRELQGLITKKKDVTTADVERLSTDTNTVELKFTWVNVDCPSETSTSSIFIQAPAGDPKAFGSILTYANRYFLTKFFLIATDKADYDTWEKTVKVTLEDQPVAEAPKPKYITSQQLKVLETALAGRDDVRKEILANISDGTLDKLAADRYQGCVAYINQRLGGENG